MGPPYSSVTEPRPPAGASAFVPTLLLALALVSWLGFQGFQLIREREQLGQAQASLMPQESAAAKLRASLDTVATSTAKLAAGGNASAQLIVDELRKRGVTISAKDAPESK